MKTMLLVIHVVVTLVLVILILLQNSKGGLGSGIAGGELYRSRRGAEKIVFSGTIIFAVLFFITSIANLIVH